MLSEGGKKAVVLLSGGLDSSTVLAIALEQGFQVYALSFDYGQKNRFEFDCARHIAKMANVVEHKVLTIDLRVFGGSSLTSSDPVEKGRSLLQIGQGVPHTYVPVRNTLFLAYALAWAEVLGACDLFIGVNAVDSSGYPDCRPEFIEAFGELANLATKIGTDLGKRITIHAPLLSLSKSEIISWGMDLGVDYSKTMTCYDPLPDGISCGTCDACILRQRGFVAAGLSDPLPYCKTLGVVAK